MGVVIVSPRPCRVEKRSGIGTSVNAATVKQKQSISKRVDELLEWAPARLVDLVGGAA